MGDSQPSTSQQQTTTDLDHGRRKPQIKKQDLYMLTALWMEQSPWALKETDTLNVVGAVFVQPDDRVLSVDCSRSNNGGIVHGAIRALLQYPDQVEGCCVYLSRQPCAHCVKILVQAAVKKVFYLPLKPEKDDEEENKSVDALFKVSPVSREVYVPNITEGTDGKDGTKGTDGDIKELKSANTKNLYGTRGELGSDESIASKVEWNECKKNIGSKIGWDEYLDPEIQDQVDEDMEKFFKWFDQGIVATGEKKEMIFKEFRVSENVLVGQDVANHLSRLAQMLSNRTDDPNRGVGCVITIDKEIVATGWNGFPSKALYGNHPRLGKAPQGSEQPKSDKYPHVIHAEQNALMRRKRRNIEGATAYVNKIPCNECLPMLCDAGVKKLVLSKGAFKDENKELTSEKKFYELLKKPPEDRITVYKQD